MNYLKNFYCKFETFLNSGNSSKPSKPNNTSNLSNYILKNNYLIKNAILKPIFNDKFNVGKSNKSNKYNNLFQPIPIISPLLNPIGIQLKKN